MGAISKLRHYLQVGRRVRHECSSGLWRQWSEILRLSQGPGRIGPGDYYSYRLFESTLSWREKLRFVGWKAEPALDALNHPAWSSLGLDKVLMYALLGEQGLAIPRTRAIYLRRGVRCLSRAQALRDEPQLRAWLRDAGNYPFFCKPSASGFGRGAVLALSYRHDDDSLVLKQGRTLPVQAFCDGLVDNEQLGQLFQTPVASDPRLHAAIGKNLCSLRMMVVIDDGGEPGLHRAFWKLCIGDNMHDNYNGGRSGNLAAAVNIDSGRISRVIQGTGLETRDVINHPETGVTLRDLAVPDWPSVHRFTLDAARLFPKLRFQQWDIALSDQGPLALEVNLFGTGGEELSQMIERRGLLDGKLAAALARR